MLKLDEKDIVDVKFFGRTITAIYQGGQLIWEAITSCFGSGYWRGDKPWIGSDAWKG